MMGFLNYSFFSLLFNYPVDKVFYLFGIISYNLYFITKNYTIYSLVFIIYAYNSWYAFNLIFYIQLLSLIWVYVCYNKFPSSLFYLTFKNWMSVFTRWAPSFFIMKKNTLCKITLESASSCIAIKSALPYRLSELLNHSCSKLNLYLLNDYNFLLFI